MITEQMLETYANHIQSQYDKWRKMMGYELKPLPVRFDHGKSYIKVVKEGSVHSFIVLADSGKFKAGDVLKAASFKAPAKNFKRGNVITGDLSNIDWQGA